jgi:hypothetical protein
LGQSDAKAMDVIHNRDDLSHHCCGRQQCSDCYLFVTRSGPYTGQDVFTLLVERVEALISNEATTWAQITKQPVKLPSEK